jgi:hypothetical protein
MENLTYFHHILSAVEKLYQNDSVLLSADRKTHEQTISFRIAHYLATALERPGLFIDCEYHGNVDDTSRRKCLGNKRVRPDIIYHDRAHCNLFCIEVKRGSMRHDDQKIWAYMDLLGYREGYCIHNIGPNYVTVHGFQ